MSGAAGVQARATAAPELVTPRFVPPRIIPGDLLPEPNGTTRTRRATGYGFQWFNMNPRKTKTPPTTTTTPAPPTVVLSRFGATGFFPFAPRVHDDELNKSM